MRPVSGGNQRPVAAPPYSPSAPDLSPGTPPSAALDEVRLRLLEVLSGEGQGMTINQLACRLASPRESVETLVEGLVELQLVGRLNTVIPTYVCRGEATHL